ncbi:MAG TPA: cyanophycinase [Gemmatimonadaceae bacterium]|nr:cyanophycinase [Gemmatimonadaceae bacterium]
MTASPTSEPANGRKTRRRGDDTTGTLVLIGGGCSAAGEALGTFVACARGKEGGRIVGLTTASSDPMGSALAWRNDLKVAGATNVEIPIVDKRDLAQDERIAKMVREANGIFLGGGDQVHLVATIGGSRVGNAIRDAYRRGAVVCGTSAGAAALTETILAGGEVDETGVHSDMHIGPGLGLLGFRVMIDTHFAQRRRLHRLFVAIAANPDLMGLGIDEDTALVVQGHLGRVVGKGGVTFVDGRGVRFDNADEVTNGAQLTLSYLRVGLVGPGYDFNLRERELESLVAARKSPETPVASVKGEAAV